MRDLVLTSHSRGEPDGAVPLKPFALDPVCATKPTTFSIDFICEKSIYEYEFVAEASAYVSESLHVIREGRRSQLFERHGREFKFGRNLKGRNQTIEDLTRPNSLFLSAAAQNNHEELNLVSRFFRQLRIPPSGDLLPRFGSRTLATRGLSKSALNFLKTIDQSITDFVIDEEPINDRYPANSRIAFASRRDLSAQSSLFDIGDALPRNMRFRLGHLSNSGKPVYFDLRDESAGTMLLLTTLDPVFRTLETGGTIVIDEFGSRVHTRASEAILLLFNDKATNPKGAQLIVATHDTNLMNIPGLRRDQVWFTEKDQGGATHLYPLTDYEVRKEDNLERGYLQGRFGAIPFAGSLTNLFKVQ